MLTPAASESAWTAAAPRISCGSRISHLGRVEISGGHCSVFPTGTDEPAKILDGFGTYVAANGDSVEVTYSGEAVLTAEGFDGSGTVTIVGGTGRFTDATGEFDLTNFTPIFPDGSFGTTLLKGRGWISYDASNRYERCDRHAISPGSRRS